LFLAKKQQKPPPKQQFVSFSGAKLAICQLSNPIFLQKVRRNFIKVTL